MEITYKSATEFPKAFKAVKPESTNLIVLISSVIEPSLLRQYLDISMRALKKNGILCLQGRPEQLPELCAPLMKKLVFKYWIAIDSSIINKSTGLPSSHAAVVIFTKQKTGFKAKKVRVPHAYCLFCNKTLKDWGGKSHLMHPSGVALSDVWHDLAKENNYEYLSLPVLQRLLRLFDFEDGKGMIGPTEGIAFHPRTSVPFGVPSISKPIKGQSKKVINKIKESLLNKVICGDAVEVLNEYPSNSVDLVFADPPYNLQKVYHHYKDRQDDEAYVEWCNSWLTHYVRILKPTGSLYLLNLPKWALHHATFLNKYLYFQNWIVWDAVSEPRGKLVPSHYALLFYTKHPTKFTFNYKDIREIDTPNFCLRASCRRARKSQGMDPKISVTDIWWDIHRIKHKKHRDLHPCQLPERLMERIIRLSSNPGDIVLDALCGTGTTAMVAAKLVRRYVAIDIDKTYVAMTERKLAEIREKGYIERKSIKKITKGITKKELQLELRDLAIKLGRLPTEKDVEQLSKYDLNLFKQMFPTWGKALKAAKLTGG